VSKVHKTNIINKIFKDRVEKITLDLVNLLIEKNRDEIIDDIYDEYHELYLEHKKIAVVTVTSAVVLDEHTTNRIVNILKHKIVKRDTIQIKNVIDKNIIGGFKVSYMDYEYDASVVSTLKRLHSVFEENLFVKGF
jgi:F-type H+-transporting ATPase subunit delta